MLREIVLDTETTGTDARGGDRLIEIGCVELINHVQTGQTFHRLVNPQRAVSEGAFAVHGISDAMLADKPVFADIVDAFVKFCGDARLVIHNAPFDVGFLNMEYGRLGPAAPPQIVLEDVVDTLLLARRRHPGAANNLDALCNRYGIDTTRRVKHGALARRADPGGSLCRAARRQADEPRPQRRRAGRDRRRPRGGRFGSRRATADAQPPDGRRARAPCRLRRRLGNQCGLAGIHERSRDGVTVTVPCIAHAMLRCNKSHLAVQHERPHTILWMAPGWAG